MWARGPGRTLAQAAESSKGAAGARDCAAHGRESEVLKRQERCPLMPNVRAKLPAEAGFVSPVRDDSTTGADRAYKACRSGSA